MQTCPWTLFVEAPSCQTEPGLTKTIKKYWKYMFRDVFFCPLPGWAACAKHFNKFRKSV